MPSADILAVMIHVADVEEGLAWYEQAFPLARRERTEDDDFEFLRLGDVQLEIVPADEKVSSGPSGTVVYWKVASLQDEVARLRTLGASLYRGPMRIERGLSMCQVQDPWGNCIGLRGPLHTRRNRP
jgi:predicted enzyme related to lactoylglutathione lyase